MPANRGAFSQLLAPGLRQIIYNELEMHPEEYSQIFNVYPSTRAYEEDLLVAGLGTVPQKPEGTPIAFDEPIQGGSQRFTHVTYALGFQVTLEMWEDDQYGTIRQVSTDFAGSIRQTIEVNAISTIVNSFGTTNSIDGVDLCSTAHPLLGGGTYGNRSTTDIALSVTGIQEMLLIFEKMVNERGLLKRLVPRYLLTSVDKQFIAGEILHSSYKPYTGTNELNVFQGRLEPMVNHYLTSSGPWWVLSEKSQHTLKFYWRMQPRYQNQDDYNTLGANYSVAFRQSNGVTYWHGIAGSNAA